ncbi:hypothetical protein [Enterococcus nangangensis]|uniref:hypothetical protein n=1 Tax=Enterococcus nangangensis TaxID=2559926 RepID=UPI0010F72C8E|nr:hypothetical protein [Enterococcus nangangensis]
MRQIEINGKWTFDDYGLLLAPDPEIGTAEPKTELIDIPAGDGSLDISEALTGEIHYKDRELKFDLLFPEDRTDWDAIYSTILNAWHGRRLPITMPQYPEYYFEGRLHVSRLEEDNSMAKVEVKATVNPYRLKKEITKVSGTVSGTSLVFELFNQRMSTFPTFKISANCQIKFNGGTYAHSSGEFTLAEILFTEGINTVEIVVPSGTTVEISYQEGAL